MQAAYNFHHHRTGGSMTKQGFHPKGHGIREFRVSTRGHARPQGAVLTQQDLADLYASEPFRRCGFCRQRVGFLWLPPFTEHTSDLLMGLVTWKDGRTITPRPVCFGCVDDWFNSNVAFTDIHHAGPWNLNRKS